jgi:hypothetical protein
MNTVRKTISMSDKVHEAAQKKMAEYGYGEFSDYIQALIRADSGVQPGALQETHTPYKTEADISPERKAELLRQAGEHLQADLEQAKEPPKKRRKTDPPK